MKFFLKNNLLGFHGNFHPRAGKEEIMKKSLFYVFVTYCSEYLKIKFQFCHNFEKKNGKKIQGKVQNSNKNFELSEIVKENFLKLNFN